MAMLGRALGVSAVSLERLGVGWDGEAFCFAMRDEQGRVIGVRRRFANGKKVCVAGSRNGLFIPNGLTGRGPLIVCEGPTDCAAALDLGLEAVGRPNCNSKVRMTVRYVGTRPVIIVADNDEAGIAGARILAEALAVRSSRVRIVVPPAGVKDLRDWKGKGLTARGLLHGT
jgi:DNA primase